jgi:phage terminase large subunit GpA-like protein
MTDAIDFLIEQFQKIPVAQEYELPSHFAERVRKLPKGLTPLPGPFSFQRFPYFRKIVDLFHPLNPAREVVLMKGNQLGSNVSVLETLLLYDIMVEPKPQCFITASNELIKTGVNTRIESMINIAGARHLIFAQAPKAKGSRNTGDTANAKEYPGGFLHFFGSKNPDRLRQNSYKSAKVDEVDAYKGTLKSEGDVVELIRNRTDAYIRNRKIYWASTPLVDQTSIIKKLFESGDQEYFNVPCKHCGEYQPLVWHGKHENGEAYGIVWENDENYKPITADPEKGIKSTVAYKCKYCGGLMYNHDKEVIMPKGKWIATAESKTPGLFSFHLSPLYNPPGMFSWDDMVKAFAECWDIKNNRIKDKEKYRTFRNTKQGLTFEESGINLRYERTVMFRRFGFVRGKVPNDLAVKDTGSPILILACSVDVQKENLFVDVKGYSAGGATWTIDCLSFDGNTASFNGPWDLLDDFIENKTYVGTDGKKYHISITLVDSGWNTEWVYAYAMRHGQGVYVCKGKDYIEGGETFKLFNQSTLKGIGLGQAFHINTGKLKDRISNAFMALQWNEEEFQPSWFPNFADDFRDDYFKQFEAEERVDIYDRFNKYIKTIWRQKGPNAANHYFDTYCYNLAALEIWANDWCRKVLGLEALDWAAFWESAREGYFFDDEENDKS